MSDVPAPESAEDLIQRANLLEDTRRSLRSESRLKTVLGAAVKGNGTRQVFRLAQKIAIRLRQIYNMRMADFQTSL